MRRDRVIGGASIALSLLIGAWLVLQWTQDQPVPEKNKDTQLPQSREQKRVESEPPKEAEDSHRLAIVLPPPPETQVPVPAPNPIASAPTTLTEAPAEPQKALKRQIAPLKPNLAPVQSKKELKIEPLKPASAPKPVKEAKIEPIKATEARPAVRPAAQEFKPIKVKVPEIKSLESKPLSPEAKPQPKAPERILNVTPPEEPKKLEPPRKLQPVEPKPDLSAFRRAKKYAPKPVKNDALARFKAQREAQQRAAKERAARSDATKPVKVKVSTKAVKSGRVFLRILEHGKGPDIEIAWPNSTRTSNRLFRRLTACYGMKTAVMDAAGQLYTSDSGSRPWRINLDRYSGFVRQVSGRLSSKEASEMRSLRRVRSTNLTSVRIFPRGVDARLLGGLGQLLGKTYRTMGRIRASYQMTARGVSINNIYADGKRIPGEIVLNPVTRRCSA